MVNGSSLDPALAATPQNIVISGKERSSSNQPAFITPNGAALSLIVAGAATNLVLNINGTSVSVTTDITKSSLTAAPSSNNTALVNDTDAADQDETRYWGEFEVRKEITIDTVGSEISGLVGKYAAFSINNGSETEYFIAFVESATKLSRCLRGCFYDSSLNPVKRIVFSNNDTITLLKLGWVFVENNGTTVDVTYVAPVISADSPTSPVTGDYWYDAANSLWKRHDGASFQSISRTLVGMFCNTTTATVGARCEPFYANYRSDAEVRLEVQTTEIIRMVGQNNFINVAGTRFDFKDHQLQWNITVDLASSADMYDATEQASTFYYLYLTDTGEPKISDMEPYYMPKFLGWYHPHNPWRAVGIAYNNGSSNLTTVESYSLPNSTQVLFRNGNGHGSTNTKLRRWTNITVQTGSALVTQSSTDGDSITMMIPTTYYTQSGDSVGAAFSFGVSRNTTQGTTAIDGITATDVVFMSEGNAVKNNGSAVIYCKRLDKLYAHTDGTVNSTGVGSQFEVRSIGNALFK